MDIRSVNNSMTGNLPAKATMAKTAPKEATIADGFRKDAKSEQLDADKMKTLTSGKGKESLGLNRQSRGLIGIGVMMGGMMAAAAMGGPFAPALMIGAMFGGLAIMAS